MPVEESNIFNPVVVIPSFNHFERLEELIQKILTYQVPVILVDDCSSQEAAIAEFHRIDRTIKEVTYHRCEVNGGKGAAVMQGFRVAGELGYSHVIQIDADFQHDVEDLPKFLLAGKEAPTALIIGQPVYDETVPFGRYFGRKLTNFWVAIETMSRQVKDVMIGYRCYPLKSVLQLLDKVELTKRMDFDIEIAVRLYWQGLNVVNIPTKIIYWDGNTSNFNAFRDNVRISLVHTRLVVAMLPKLPKLLWRNCFRKPIKNESWQDTPERGSLWGLRLTLFVFKLLGHRVATQLALLVTFFFFITDRAKAKSVLNFNRQIHHYFKDESPFTKEPGYWSSYSNFANFGRMLIDRISSWSSTIDRGQLKVEVHGAELLYERIGQKKGSMILSGHYGNIEALRARASKVNTPVSMLMYTANAQNYNRVLKSINPKFAENMICSESIGIDTLGVLQETLEKGHVLGVLSDRAQPTSTERVVEGEFLGKKMDFPYGPYVLPLLLEVPVFALFSVRTGRLRYRVEVCQLFSGGPVSRKDRDQVIQEMLQLYLGQYEAMLQRWPHQWFNFNHKWKN